MKTRAMNVAESKAARIVYVTGQIELLRAQAREATERIVSLCEEKDRLVGHIGYDPTHGKTPEVGA